LKYKPWLKAHDLLSKRLERAYPLFDELHIQLKKGGVLIAYKAYVALMVFLSMLALIIAVPTAFILLPFVAGIAMLSVMNLLLSFAIGVSIAAITLVIMYLYPGMKASGRKRPIENNLPYIANFLTLLSSSNVPPSVIFKSIARIDTLKEIRYEFTSIIRDVEVFGSDLMSSILQNAKLTPNDNLKEILIGYVATVRTGGSPTEYLKVTSEKVTKERIGKLDMMLESLSAIAEIYIMLLVAAPLLFVVLFATLGMVGGGGFQGLSMGTILYLLIYLGIPIMGAIMIVIMSTFEK
jgi:flagellar protein FlaJ